MKFFPASGTYHCLLYLSVKRCTNSTSVLMAYRDIQQLMGQKLFQNRSEQLSIFRGRLPDDDKSNIKILVIIFEMFVIHTDIEYLLSFVLFLVHYFLHYSPVFRPPSD